MSENNFSNKPCYGYIKSVKSLFCELGIDLSNKELYYDLKQLLEIYKVKEFNYRVQMRKTIGHSPLILPGGNIISYCYNPNGNISLLIQNRKDLTGGKYSFCGGAQQLFQKGSYLTMEPARLTAYREIQEETSISINNLELELFFDYSSFIEYQNGDKVLAPSIFFLVEVPYEIILEMSKNECDEEWTHMTHSLVNIQDINNEFIQDFFPNHRQALVKFLKKFS